VLELWEATDDPARFGVKIDGVDVGNLILAGASPRGMSALLRAARVVAWLADRSHLVPDDIHAVLPSALGHRIFFTPIYELRRAAIADQLVAQIMNRVASP
jgi:MoxR-like ATPase